MSIFANALNPIRLFPPALIIPMFSATGIVFFGGHLTDVESSSRMITKKAWADLKFDATKTDLVQQMGLCGTKKKQKFLEIIGNEGE